MSVISMREFHSVEFFKVTPPSKIKTLPNQFWSNSSPSSNSINKFSHTSRNTFHSPSSSTTTTTNSQNEPALPPAHSTPENDPIHKDLLEYTFTPDQLSVNPSNHILTGSLEVRQVIKELHDSAIIDDEDDEELIPESIYQLQIVLKTLTGQPWAVGVYDTLQYQGQPIVKPTPSTTTTTTTITTTSNSTTSVPTITTTAETETETSAVMGSNQPSDSSHSHSHSHPHSYSHFTTIEQISENKYIVFINYVCLRQRLQIWRIKHLGCSLKMMSWMDIDVDVDVLDGGLRDDEEEDGDGQVLIENVNEGKEKGKGNQLNVKTKTVVYDDESDGEIVTVVKEHVDSELSERIKNLSVKYEDDEDEEDDDFGDFIAA
ncbi:unnamed protein product [Ambrosiozyma monospora]|uniref:Unnamed protein product n=1 Tax=Ambrosiozyma monospora TaxID=43982 RepID=A0ACB5TCR1_AMBMO|nr:unnamed protein product [Ambrosiozyma monospora]